MDQGAEPHESLSPVPDRWGTQATIELTVLAILVLAVRFVDLGRPPFIDEMNHVLAATSILSNGSMTIHEGVGYERGALFTYFVAGFYAIFGQSLEVARLPALLSGVLLVCLLFAWLRVEAGRIAGWTGGLLLGFAPVAIYLSQWVRFYTLQALLFWGAAWGVYRLVERKDPVRRRWLIGVGSIAALLAAFHLQVTTVVGVAGLGLFVALVEGPRLLSAMENRSRRFLVLAALTVALGATFGVLHYFHVLDWFTERAQAVDVWAIERATNVRFYHRLFLDQYGFLWVLLPLAGLLALASRWRLPLLFLCVFGLAVVIHSLAAWKAERYIFYAMPAWFAVWGLAAREVLPWLWNRLLVGSEAIVGRLPRTARNGLVGSALFLGLAFAITGVTAYTTTRVIYLQRGNWTPPASHTGEMYAGHPDWNAVASRLNAIGQQVDVVVGEPDLKLVYYLGDVDYVLYAGYLVESARQFGPHDLYPEFRVWRKIGRPLVSAPGSVELIMACYRSGLVVAEQHVWGWRGGVPQPTAEFIEQHARAVELPAETGILAFRWETEQPEGSPRCSELRKIRENAPVHLIPAEAVRRAAR